MFLVGLSGGIASGKSTVVSILRELGCAIIDADVIARQVVQVGTPAHSQIVLHFGEEVLKKNGELDREKMAAIIFSSPEKRSLLNSITHPPIRRAMLRQTLCYFFLALIRSKLEEARQNILLIPGDGEAYYINSMSVHADKNLYYILEKDPYNRTYLLQPDRQGSELGSEEFSFSWLYLTISYKYVILDIPLLFESRTMTRYMKHTVLVYCDPQTQVERLMRRSGLSREEVQKRLAAQLPIDSKLPLADHVINNSGDRESTRRQVLQLHQRLESSLGYLPTRIAAVTVAAGLVALMWSLLRRLWP